MTPEDFIYSQTFKRCMSLGFTDRDAGHVAADAVSSWRRRGGACSRHHSGRRGSWREAAQGAQVS